MKILFFSAVFAALLIGAPANAQETQDTSDNEALPCFGCIREIRDTVLQLRTDLSNLAAALEQRKKAAVTVELTDPGQVLGTPTAPAIGHSIIADDLSTASVRAMNDKAKQFCNSINYQNGRVLEVSNRSGTTPGVMSGSGSSYSFYWVTRVICYD